MKLIDTPNPNAKKVETNNTSMGQEELLHKLKNVEGVSSVFFGPGFITITKSEKYRLGCDKSRYCRHL